MSKAFFLKKKGGGSPCIYCFKKQHWNWLEFNYLYPLNIILSKKKEQNNSSPQLEDGNTCIDKMNTSFTINTLQKLTRARWDIVRYFCSEVSPCNFMWNTDGSKLWSIPYLILSWGIKYNYRYKYKYECCFRLNRNMYYSLYVISLFYHTACVFREYLVIWTFYSISFHQALNGFFL